MVPSEIELRWRHERCKLLYQFQGFIDHVGSSVAPAVLETIEEPAVRQKRQPFGSKRRTERKIHRPGRRANVVLRAKWA
jgi:hypothetical protein